MMRDLRIAAVLTVLCVSVALANGPVGQSVAAGLATALTVARIAGLVVCGCAAALVFRAVARFAIASPAARRNYPRMWLCRARWRWLTRSLGLAYVDPHGKRKSRAPFGPAIGSAVRIETRKGHVRHPRARFRADAYGVTATVRTIPRAGRAEFEKCAQHIADEWGCVRVSVSQPRPGRVTVRGLRTDPLAGSFGPEGAPPGTYTDPAPFAPYLGRDEFGTERYGDLSGITGISIVGQPGYGKTSLVSSLLCQMAGSGSVQFVFIDGKGGGDYSDWAPRAWLSAGDELPDAVGVLEDVHALMRWRLGRVERGELPRNSWHAGPSPANPLIVTVIDEAHTYFDLDAVKGDREAERQVRACRTLAGQLIKKGRSVLFVTVLLTQKGTSDALPTSLRDNCGLGFSFAVKTRDAAVAGLGEAIREYPSYCPTGLRDRSMIGVCTASLPNGADPFVRLRVPEITDAAASARAAETARLRADPNRPRVVVPEPEPVPA